MAKDIHQRSTGSLEAVSRWLTIITPGSRSSILSYHLQRTRLLESDQNRQTHLWYRIPINKFYYGIVFLSSHQNTWASYQKAEHKEMHGHEKYPHSTTKHFSSHQKIPTARSSLSSPQTAPVWTVLSTSQVHKKRLFLNRDIRESFTAWHRMFSIIMQHLWPLRDMPVVPSSHFDNQIHCHTFPTLLLRTPPPSPHAGRWPQLRTSTSTYPNHQPPYRPPCRKLLQ